MSNQDKENGVNKSVINWYPGHMVKTKKEISNYIELIDIVFEVIDSRIPKSSKNEEINSLIKNKPRILIMTKKDLCDINETSKWKKYYEDLGYKVVILDLINKPQLDSIYKVTDNILKSLNEKRIQKGLKTRKARVLVLGIPNVGKSTLINRLVGKKSTNVGNRPGVTKHLEWIRINDKLELLDTPGILWPRLEGENIGLNLAAMTAIKEELLNKEDVAIYIIKKMLELYPENIINRYNLNIENNKKYDIINVLEQIGNKYNYIKNKEIDYDRIYLRIIKDLKDGYLGKITFDRL